MSKAATSKDLLATFQKQHGAAIGSFGGSLVDVPRLPTGVFAFDVATGGGWPRGKASILYGPESSGKTNLVLRSIRMHQLLHPDDTAVFLDIEHSWDPVWAALMGVDTDRVAVLSPDYAEQAVDMAESFLYADDCGMVVIDSLAALTTQNEVESSAEKQIVGGASNSIGKLCRKATIALSQVAKANRHPTLLMVNQTRFKIGVMFGDPEGMPGGNAPKFMASLWVRVYGKNKTDPKVSKTMPVIKDVQFVLKKWKVPVLAANGRFEMAMIPHDGLRVGECDDFSTVKSYLEGLDLFDKTSGKKGGWTICGEDYPTQQAFKDRLVNEPTWAAEFREALIKRLLAEGALPADADA